MDKTFFYIGNRKPGEGSGMAVFCFDAETGALRNLGNELETMKLCIGCTHIDGKRKILYCTDEVQDYPGLPGGGGGRLFAFEISPGNGGLKLIGSRPSYGAKPSYLTTDEDSKYLLVTNHGGRTTATSTEKDAFGRYHLKVSHDESSVALFPLNGDGSIGEPVHIFRLEGSGPKFFQHSAHAHSIVKAPGKNLYAVCDKGGDQIYIFRIDYENKKVVPCEGTPYLRSAGSAPRYAVFHPSRPYLYVNKESETILSSFRYSDQGKLEQIETISTLPEGYDAPPRDALSQSDICISGNGKFLYDMLRIVNVINVYEIDETSGKLTLIQTLNTPDGGRAFGLSPDGHFMAVAFHDSHRTDIYAVGADGKLQGVVSSAASSSPSTVSFFSTS
ncbi:beta-propeller fold lactonase family protein [[Clostridium] symbiosum]|uniref:lactonase family protein n=1 Tax=Clostridium symbiosum TaxID=1512 RepID=UPI001D09286B|nr:beta-propeller fold lactonase family protein [[Clostridium] symbiosum]MCB6610021.1 lactonase family protein [[Clostridium] symbiosum]MCB6931426.1 lactonase family protein [[Clostridium] symbiosum]